MLAYFSLYDDLLLLLLHFVRLQGVLGPFKTSEDKLNLYNVREDASRYTLRRLNTHC